MKDDLAAQRGKRGVITIKVGDVIQTVTMPAASTRDPLEVTRRRARASRVARDAKP